MSELKFRKPDVSIEQAKDEPNKATFTVSPLKKGFGLTLGNSLRRILMSSLPGTAIVNAQIDGVSHEFQTIDGVVEDVMSIVLNLKNVIFSTDSLDDDFEKEIEVHRDTPGVVRAGDFQIDHELEVVNPDQEIATVTEGGKFSMFMTVRRGIGYSSSETNKIYSNIIGTIPIDSIFTPVERVTFKVDKTRVDRDVNYDKLQMEVKTNGALAPYEAISLASKIMMDYLTVIVDLDEDTHDIEFVEEKLVEEKDLTFERPIEELDLGVRAFNSLKRDGIHTIGELISKTDEEIIRIRNLGTKSLTEIKEKLEEMDLSLAPSYIAKKDE